MPLQYGLSGAMLTQNPSLNTAGAPMVYSLENMRILQQEHERLTEKSIQLRKSLAELKLRTGLDPDSALPRPETDPQAEADDAAPPFSPGFFSGRFTV